MTGEVMWQVATLHTTFTSQYAGLRAKKALILSVPFRVVIVLNHLAGI